MRGVAYANAEVLQERVPKTYSLYPIDTYWYLRERTRDGYAPRYTEICREEGHYPNCIKYHNAWSDPLTALGEWELKTPINFKGDAPGSGHRLTFVQLKGMYRVDPGTWTLQDDRWVVIFSKKDSVEERLWYASGNQLERGNNQWYTNRYSLDIDLSPYPNFSVYLNNLLKVLTGRAETHYAEMIVTIDYIPGQPPEPATVKVAVRNRQTARPVSGARVALKSGERIIAEGYTDLNGEITMYNIPAGVEGVSYTLVVSASGFYDYSGSVEVKPGTNAFSIDLAPKPFSWEELTLWQWLLIGGAVVVVGGVAMAAIGRAAGRERIVVVR